MTPRMLRLGLLFLACAGAAACAGHPPPVSRTPPERLAQLVLAGRFAQASREISTGIDLNAPLWGGESLLEHLCLRADAKALAFLLDNGARRLDSAFRAAVRGGNFANAEFLLKRGADVDSRELYGRDALFFAALDRDAEAASKLLAWKARPRLEHQLVFCPAAELHEAQRLILGDLAPRCLCPKPARVELRCERSVLLRTCARTEGGRKILSGFATLSQADCLGSRRVPYRLSSAVFYEDGEPARRWTCGDEGCAESP